MPFHNLKSQQPPMKLMKLPITIDWKNMVPKTMNQQRFQCVPSHWAQHRRALARWLPPAARVLGATWRCGLPGTASGPAEREPLIRSRLWVSPLNCNAHFRISPVRVCRGFPRGRYWYKEALEWSSKAKSHLRRIQALVPWISYRNIIILCFGFFIGKNGKVISHKPDVSQNA